MKNTTYHWTSLFGKPEKIKEEYYIDDYGHWDSQFYRQNGDFIPFKPNPLELSRTKKALLEKNDYFKRVRKAISKVKY